MPEPKRILIAPLDWGIGHATRCIPLIDGLLQLGQKPVVAADGAPLHLLRQRFPELGWTRFPGMAVTYSKSKSVPLAIARQLPAILKQAYTDQRVIEHLVSEQQADAVISDNRFGAYSRRVPSVFVTHQLNLRLGQPFRWAEPLTNTLNRYFIGRYQACWVPDFQGQHSLAGALSQCHLSGIPLRYIGPLSRLKPCETKHESPTSDFLVMLSGPEPHRTIFENAILHRFYGKNDRVVILRALPLGAELPEHSPNIVMHNHLDDAQLAELIHNARNILARAGYSTLMDLWTMRRYAFLVPTPAQPEQEYLADFHHQKGGFRKVLQHELDQFSTDCHLPPFGMTEAGNDQLLLSHLSEWLATL